MALSDHVSPREGLRADLKEHLRVLADAAIERVDTTDMLTSEVDPDGEAMPVWQNVPVLTARALGDIIRTVFEGPLPPPSSKTGEASTPALFIVYADCPRCHITQRMPMTVDVELHQDRDGETLHLKAKSKEAIHNCGQLPLPEGEETDGQTALDELAPVPTSLEVMAAIEGDGSPYLLLQAAFIPSLGRIDEWPDETKREVKAWADAVNQSATNTLVVVPALPTVLGGIDKPEITSEDMDAEADLGSEEEAEDDLLPA